METLVNRNPKTLASAISGDNNTTMVLSDVIGLPSTGNVRAIIDDELLLVTLSGTTTVTITRGIESTTAAPHSSGANVNFILTAGSVRQYSLDICQTGPYNSRPSSSSACQTYIDNDSPTIGVNNGTNFVTYWRDIAVNPPIIGNFTPVGYAVVTGSHYIVAANKGAGQLIYYANNNSGAHNVGGFVFPVNSNPTIDWTATLGFEMCSQTAGNFHGGICGYESSSGKLILYGPQNGGSVYEQLVQYDTSGTSSSSSSSYVSGIISNPVTNFNTYRYLQIRYRHATSTTGVSFYQSVDGLTWNTVGFQSFSTMSVSTLDNVGFALRCYENFNYDPTSPSGMTVYHWLYQESS